LRSSSLLLFAAAALLPNAIAQSLDVPFVRQQKQGCGPAVLSMLIEYWSENGSPTPTPWTPRELYDRLYDAQIHGISGESMVGFLRDQNYAAYGFRGEWNDLKKNISLGRPVIAALAPKKGQPLHFVVIVGIDTDSRPIVHDPDRAAYVKEPIDRFLKQWNGADRWTLLAVPRTQTERFEQ
jgi:ABC-type bacteriocin/lantibiotic exporter with double-glycine peptidase domain